MDSVTIILLVVSFLMIVAIGVMIYFLENEDSADYPIVGILIVENGRGRSDEQVNSAKEFAPWATINVVDLTGRLVLPDSSIKIQQGTGTMKDVFMNMGLYAAESNILFLGDTTFPKKKFHVSELFYRQKRKVAQVYQSSLTKEYVDPSAMPLCLVHAPDLVGLSEPIEYVSHLTFIEDGLMDQSFTQDVFVTSNVKVQEAQFTQAADHKGSNIFFTLHSSFDGADDVITEWLTTSDYLR